MKSLFKNKIVTIIILIATLVLAGIAVFTAFRLYQLRQESVAPNAPTSKPAAAIGSGEGSLNNCSLPTFTITQPECTLTAVPTTLTMKVGEQKQFNVSDTGDPGDYTVTSANTSIATVSEVPSLCLPNQTCTKAFKVIGVKVGTAAININSPNKKADGSPLCAAVVNVTVSEAEAGSCPTNFTVTKSVSPESVDPGGEVTYTVAIERTSATPTSVTISRIEDALDGDYVEDSTTTISATTTIDEPTVTDATPSNTDDTAILLTWDINEAFVDSEKLTFTYKVKVPSDHNADSDHANTVTIIQAGTPETGCSAQEDVHINTATSSPSPSPSNVASPTPTPPASCNNGCTTDANCSSGLKCISGSCRNEVCSTETDCTCAIAGGSPTPSPLPDAGISYPTILGAGLGILVILGAILLII